MKIKYCILFFLGFENLTSSFKSLLRKPLSLSISNYITVNNDKLDWREDGYKTWVWNNQKVNYIDLGRDSESMSKPPLLLVHGFGGEYIVTAYTT